MLAIHNAANISAERPPQPLYQSYRPTAAAPPAPPPRYPNQYFSTQNCTAAGTRSSYVGHGLRMGMRKSKNGEGQMSVINV
ncbi:Protein of unknown function [Pyronema omphalodes CBS 100304]|uniref:Uncharacterized protein n=1 Tax=Pyronema omphalodes (strain CBS 100304) TaxID=1076935 RepID=U4L2F1_PYROM|nr:Protein of unknown function [Pyronema omphalodes CBS 100304]